MAKHKKGPLRIRGAPMPKVYGGQSTVGGGSVGYHQSEPGYAVPEGGGYGFGLTSEQLGEYEDIGLRLIAKSKSPREVPDFPAPHRGRGRPKDRVFNPLVALEKQLEFVRVAESDRLGAISYVGGTEFASKYFLSSNDVKTVMDIKRAGKFSFAGLAKSATPAFVSADMVDLIVDAMETLPDTVSIHLPDLQAENQFIWLEKPVPLGSPDWAKFQNWAQGFFVTVVPDDLRDSWRKEQEKLAKENAGVYSEEDGEEILVTARAPEILVHTIGYVVGAQGEKDWQYTTPDGRTFSDWQFLDMLDWQNWLTHDTISVNYGYERGRRFFLRSLQRTDDPETVSYSFLNNKIRSEEMHVPTGEYLRTVDRVAYEGRRLAAAVIHFMRQRIVRVSRETFPYTRAERRRLEREKKPELPRLVDVVRLRVIDYVGADGSKPETGNGRQLTSRHIRRAHWRNQFYPSINAHKPKLIPMTVVGPEGTPIRGGSKLFAVVR